MRKILKGLVLVAGGLVCCRNKSKIEQRELNHVGMWRRKGVDGQKPSYYSVLLVH